ncbi:MAG: DUF2794 domain-containing protein [Alphaproteobacteria bacterium]
MSNGEDGARLGGHLPGLRATPVTNRSSPPEIWFDRREINAILRVYGRKVAVGEWRDYAIDHRRGEAVFSIFRRTSEVPLYRIVKNPHLARRQGAYAVLSAGGYILKRGHDLNQVLFALDRGPRLVRA